MTNTTRGTAAALALGLAVTAAGCTGAPERTPPEDAGPVRLVAFDSCRQALGDLKAAARPYVGAYGFQFGGAGRGEADAADGRMAAGPAEAEKSAPEHSRTNTHEAGVDEPDMVKTDGRRIVTVVDGVLRVVDVAGREETGTLRLPGATAETGQFGTQLLLYGDRALVVLPGYPAHYDMPATPRDDKPAYPVSGTEVLLVDLSGTPEIVSRMKLDGEYVDARMVDDQVRLVTRSVPRVPFRYPDGERMSPARAERENRIILDKSRIDDWLPRYEITSGGTTSTGRVGCGQLSRPASYSGTSMLTVLSLGIQAEALSGERSVSIVADGRTVYGAGNHLYVANDQRAVMPLDTAGGEPRKPRTEIYKFDVSKAGTPRHVASGAVPGWLLNQYAMSEHTGHLRVATTTGDPWMGGREDRPRTESAVYVLAHEGAKLTTVGQVGGLGKGEQIYSVRFVGPVGYVVTFRQVDPLYVLDLRDPEHPKVTGELKITGYSAYLHPASADRLIGVGQEASKQGRRLGLQVSLFDVSDPASPTRLSQYHVKGANSAAEFDPHAFLYWPKTGLLVLPVWNHEVGPVDAEGKPVEPHGGALVLKVSESGITEVGTVDHPVQDYRRTIQRSLMIDGALWTVSQAGVQANDGTTLKERAWIPFQ